MQAFKDHLNDLLHHTITDAPLTLLNVKGSSGQLTFRRGGASPAPTEVPVRSKFGRLHLQIGQTCLAEEQGDGKYRLRTRAYRYTIRPEGAKEPALRWEYVSVFDRGNPCRHHLQGPHKIPLGRKNLQLNDCHLPTGYVTLEEIIRFCIVDLAVKARSKDWHERLEASYGLFKTKFAPRGAEV